MDNDIIWRVAGAIEAALPATISLHGAESRRAAVAAITALREPTGAMLAPLDGETPFVARRNKMNDAGREYEVVEMTNDDWREVISDEQVIRGRFATQTEADALLEGLAREWRWSAVIDAALSERAK